jgi:hypothetical protein
VLIVGAAACTINPSANSQETASLPRVHVSALPSGAGGPAVWVLSPVGLNVRSTADANSTRLTTVTQGAKLMVSERLTVGSDTWLHVKTESGAYEGWVLDRPDLVIHRDVSQHVEQSPSWTMLFPAEWSPTTGNPATFTGSSGPTGGSMLVQTSDDPNKLPATPITAGRELRQESPIEVYGRTTFLTIYQLNAGGFEFDVKVQFPKTKVAYLFDYKQPGGANPDDTLFKQLLGSVIVGGE